jgi:hypothetical protein
MLNRKRTFNGTSFVLCAWVLVISTATFGQSDNFDDNSIGAQWTLIEDSPSTLSLLEQNQQLEVIASAPPTADIDAIYLSNGASGFKLSATEDFKISIDYSYTGAQSLGASLDVISLVLGIGRDLNGTDSAAIGVGLTGFNILGYAAAYRINDQQNIVTLGIPPATGNIFVSYDASEDDLTLGLTGASSHLLDDTVVGLWSANSLLVSFGARGEGHTLVSGNASLDNFLIESGTVLPIPEPATATLLLFAAALGLSRRRYTKKCIMA